jgi:trimethylamine:corrinoid methyltransferase-like protein
VLGGRDKEHDLLIERGRIFTQLVVDDEFFGIMFRVLKGINVDEETLATEFDVTSWILRIVSQTLTHA